MHRSTIAAVAAVSIISLTQIASAADLPSKAPAYVPPVPVADWSGVYVGLEGGYGWGKQNSSFTLPGHCVNCDLEVNPTPWPEEVYYPDVALPSVTQRGWLFGGFAGVQKQWGSWVLGLEADFDGADIKGSETASTVSNLDRITIGGLGILCVDVPGCIHLTHDASIESKIDMLGSLRGKVGFVPAPNWLIYGTGGAAFAHLKNTVTSTELSNVSDLASFSSQGSAGTSLFGWAAGGGVNWKWPVDAGSAWVFGVEYLHYQFGDHTITITDNTGGSFAFNTTERVDTIKGRISYLFSIH